MRCEQVKEFLSAYLDSQLVLEEREAIATHLRTCTECSNMLMDFRYFDALLSRLPRVAPDASLRQKVFSSALPNQLVIVLSDRQQGIYLVDTQHDTSLQLDSSNARGPIL